MISQVEDKTGESHPSYPCLAEHNDFIEGLTEKELNDASRVDRRSMGASSHLKVTNPQNDLHLAGINSQSEITQKALLERQKKAIFGNRSTSKRK